MQSYEGRLQSAEVIDSAPGLLSGLVAAIHFSKAHSIRSRVVHTDPKTRAAHMLAPLSSDVHLGRKPVARARLTPFAGSASGFLCTRGTSWRPWVDIGLRYHRLGRLYPCLFEIPQRRDCRSQRPARSGYQTGGLCNAPRRPYHLLNFEWN